MKTVVALIAGLAIGFAGGFVASDQPWKSEGMTAAKVETALLHRERALGYRFATARCSEQSPGVYGCTTEGGDIDGQVRNKLVPSYTATVTGDRVKFRDRGIGD